MIQAPECGSNRPDNANDCRRNAANGNEGRNTNTAGSCSPCANKLSGASSGMLSQPC